MTSEPRPRFGHYVSNAFLRGLMGLALALPYAQRVRLMGWLTAQVVAPLAGYRKRIRQNLAHAWPDLPPQEVERLCREVPNNAGRTLIEIYSGTEFNARMAQITPRGPGLAAMDAARDAGTPVLMVSGHFGNYDSFRSCMSQRGHRIGGLYRNMDNPLFNQHYVHAINQIAQPLWPRGRRGLAQMVKFLRQGNGVALLSDQYVQSGHVLDFFGQPAPSALSAAEMALKYDAQMFPVYGIRQPDGLSFDIIIEEPIPHSDAVTMMQAFNDSLEARIRENPGQWLWIHKRWKPERAAIDARAQLQDSN